MPKGVVWRQEDVIRVLGGGIDFDTGEKVADEYRRSARPRPRRPTRARASSIAPLMHGAAQWGTFGSLFNGKTLVLMPKFDADEVWKAIEQHRITGVEHHRRRDGAARSIEALEAGGYDASSLVDDREHRGGVLGDGEGPVPRTLPEPDHRRSGRLDRDRLQRRDA